ncbi:MAG: hypothetical protein AB8G16_09445 [Gammaproteobacteria bacterium]
MTISNSAARCVRLAPARRQILAATALLGTLCLTPAAWALGTTAGTDILNEATVTFDVGGNTLTETSNEVTVTVAELVDVEVTLQSPQTATEPGLTNQELLFTVTNTGNGDETYSLVLDSALAGDDFDPVPSAVSIFFDTDGSGDLSPGDTPYTPGGNDPLLAPDASIAVLIVNDIPAAPGNGDLGDSALIATSQTGTGAPGTVVAGAGEGGVDAVIGTSTGTATQTGQYVISTVNVAVVKTATVTDPFGGNEPVPGATIVWRIEVTAAGSGTAAAAAVNDLVPANTTYTPASLTLNAGALTDAPDGDVGQYLNATNSIDVQLGDLDAAAGTQVVEFAVTID